MFNARGEGSLLETILVFYYEEFSMKHNTEASCIFKFSSIIYHDIPLSCNSAMQLIILVIVKFLQN